MYIILCVYSVAHKILIFNHSYRAVHSIILIMVSMTFFFLVPAKPIPDRALHIDLATNPLQPPSIGAQPSLHPLFLHVSRSSSYLNFFRSRASSTCFSHGTVNSHIIIFFLFENINISERNDVWAIWSGNFNIVSKSALNSQSVACNSTSGVGFSFGLDFTPALTNLIKFFLVIWCICTDGRTDYLHYFV